MTFLFWLNWAGISFFAATGALSASRKQLDIIGFMFLGTIAGIGGGTLRDLLLGVDVFWIKEHAYILVCALSAGAVYFIAHHLESRYRLLLWLDALGLAAYGIYGAHKGLMVTGSPIIAVVTAMLTGAFGGILRDVVAGEPSMLLRKDLYISAVLIGASAFVVAQTLLDVPQMTSLIIGVVVTFAIRAGSLIFGWTLPSYQSRPGRPIPSQGNNDTSSD